MWNQCGGYKTRYSTFIYFVVVLVGQGGGGTFIVVFVVVVVNVIVDVVMGVQFVISYQFFFQIFRRRGPLLNRTLWQARNLDRRQLLPGKLFGHIQTLMSYMLLIQRDRLQKNYK